MGVQADQLGFEVFTSRARLVRAVRGHDRSAAAVRAALAAHPHHPLPRGAQRPGARARRSPSNIAFDEPIRKYHEACDGLGAGSNLAYIKAVNLDEDHDRATIEEGRETLTNFIRCNVSPTDSLDGTPEGKEQLIKARYEFYAPDDFVNTRNLSYDQLLEFDIVYAGSPDRVADQLVDLLDRFRFDEFLLIASASGVTGNVRRVPGAGFRTGER